MRNIRSRRGRRKSKVDLNPIRRREIIRHALYRGAADTEDFDRWLIAHVWHNPEALRPAEAVMAAAEKMGGQITRADAIAIVDEATTGRWHPSADGLAWYLGVTYDERQTLRLWTIGSTNVNKADRKEIRRVRDKVRARERRRAKGVRPRTEYEANSLSRLKPWAAEDICRKTWERRRRRNMKPTLRVASVSAAYLLKAEDGLATARTAEGSSTLIRKEASGLRSSQTVTMMAVDVYQSLPIELRLLALGLPLPDEMRMVA
jgi:hypothetical protein